MKLYQPPLPSMSIGIIGEGKTGKSFMSLGFPTPTVYVNWDHFSFDRAFRGFCQYTGFAGDVLEMELQEDFSKYSADYFLYRVNKASNEGYLSYVNKVLSTIMAALRSPKIATVVIDTDDLMWEAVHEAHRESLGRQGLMPWEYGVPNSQMADMYNDAKINGTNLVTIHHMKPREVWGAPGTPDQNKVIGFREGAERLDGWKYTPSHADLIVELEEVKGAGPNSPSLIRMSLHKSGFSFYHHGRQMEWPTYVSLLGVIDDIGTPQGTSLVGRPALASAPVIGAKPYIVPEAVNAGN